MRKKIESYEIKQSKKKRKRKRNPSLPNSLVPSAPELTWAAPTYPDLT